MTRIGAALTAALIVHASNALAAEPSVMRVAVVPSAGQMSLVVELTDEARNVSTQQATPTQLLLEAGPIALPLKRQVLNAPSGLALVQRVSVDEGTTAGKEHVLRVGVTMKQPAPSTVRVVGRRIYIDFVVPDLSMPVASARAAAPAPAPAREEREAAPAANRNRPAAGDQTYRQLLNGATSRLQEIEPFLLSATSAPTPNPAVLSAVAEAITGVQQSLRGVQAPANGGAPLQLLVSAASLAAEAVSADFHGDRASRAKQSMAIFAAAKAQLQ
jgi:hypothetical protein